MNKVNPSSTLDRVADSLQSLAVKLPREASFIDSLLLRLDRVSNQLDKDQRKSSRIAELESELETSGKEFAVDPMNNTLHVYKGSDDPRRELSFLKGLSQRYGANLEDSPRDNTYKLSLPNGEEA